MAVHSFWQVEGDTGTEFNLTAVGEGDDGVSGENAARVSDIGAPLKLTGFELTNSDGGVTCSMERGLADPGIGERRRDRGRCLRGRRVEAEGLQAAQRFQRRLPCSVID